MKFAVIVSNRSFFPDHLVTKGREDLLALIKAQGYEVVILGTQEAPLGAVETSEDAEKCAALFQANPDISGIIVCLPNFGDEVAVSSAIRKSGLRVPVLIQACDDDLERMDLANRRDAFCGKLSLCNVLRQNGIPYTLTQLHTCAINSMEFAIDLQRFASICSIVKGLKNVKIGAIGARPNPFHTVRYSEKLLQYSGIEVDTCDMSEIIASANAIPDDAPAIATYFDRLRGYAQQADSACERSKLKQAKLTLALENWINKTSCAAVAVQCWDTLEKNYGCAACLSMSLLGSKGVPAACEMDVTGAVSLLVLQLASNGKPGYMDWDNNYGNDRNKCVNVHCANYPDAFFGGDIKIGYLDILGTTLGKENCYGACHGRVAPGAMTFLKISTDDVNGTIRAYIGAGEFTDDPLDSFGGVAVCHVPGLQGLMHFIAEEGFEHHVALVRGVWTDAIAEALSKYMGWAVHVHKA